MGNFQEFKNCTSINYSSDAMRTQSTYLFLLGVSMLGMIMLFSALQNLPSPEEEKTEERDKWKQKNITLSKEEIQRMIKEAEAASGSRLHQVEEVCRKYNLGLYRQSPEVPLFVHPPTPQYSVFYIDRQHKLSWCPLYKAASTTWLYNLCLLGGYSEGLLASSKKQLSDLARETYPEMDFFDAEEALQTTLKLLVVRHPFERLLSAYRDKLENTRVGQEHGTLHYYRKYGRRIVAKYRLGGNATKMDSLLQPDQYLWDPLKPKPAGFEPTFEEFVRYILDTDLPQYADDHWIPYYLFCTPCLVKYDIIAKVETLLRDQVYVIHSLGLQDVIKPRWKHRTKQNSEISKIYFSQLSTVQVQGLYNKYQLDFELFGYKLDDYLKYARIT